ncbi:LexA/Signal peptidase [Lepidopterella palustris CBS 459.81]|uniref:Mitochondrial inner membrane protease subunit n=1 Tax=Lepidopterella palustris CBS 459.81 TaxID=1314670 RepID=A0A8E2EC62_9PEZI|nr:LexA/Signal peptidase [Lepidopterella palustris CBS 459.81]
MPPTIRTRLPRPHTLIHYTYRFAIGISIYYFFTDHLFDTAPVRGASMSPTLSPLSKDSGIHDRVLLRRLQPTVGLQRGDVVTFWKPHKPEEVSIKRVVGLEGDTVVLRDREEGTEGGGEGEVVKEGEGTEAGRRGRVIVKVPFGHVWVEGDCWRGSFDSNDFGPVSF